MTAFLGGAKSRLLPASIPLRFFGAAVAYHLLAWLALAAGAAEWPQFAGGLGWPLAALHLVTLGVLGMTAIGAGAQLLPVATRQGAPGHRLLLAVWWLVTPGVAVLSLGMGLMRPLWLGAGALAVLLGFAAWGVLMARNLRGARGMPGVVAHVWAALASLVVMLASALALAGVWLGMPGFERGTALALHIVFAPYGFMGMLALGLSSILVPMFALGDAPTDRRQLTSCALAVAALALGAFGSLAIVPAIAYGAALVAGAAAVALHLQSMNTVLRSGMRRDLGRSFVLVKIGWGGLAASLALAAALVANASWPRLATGFGLAVIGVWLLSFVLGLLQRIAPFLAAMHGAGTGRRARTPSSLTHEPALRVHFACHVAALALLAIAIGADSTALAALGAAVGAAGALAFGVFYAVLLVRMRRH